MKQTFTVAALLMASTILTGCLIDTDRPGNNPPSMMMERDSMPDKVNQRTGQINSNKNTEAETR
ncbi:hypothetical protein [Nitrosomonas sp. HPC101]|uniref:hypothetical protein n=1 Tax=Nitrosomonas sp. HPC101 TaxID=1658667 RepID=UPI00136FB3CB|nr:hypothetical protein [Nitrosomonas sp. HPC101]